MNKLSVGLVGLGQIGSGVYKILTSKKDLLLKKTGVSFEIKKIAVRTLGKNRGLKPERGLLTNDYREVVSHEGIDCVVELIGGIHPAREVILQALKNGKDVVTANKALLAEYGHEIFPWAHRHGRRVLFEASVGGGIPVIKSLREGLVSNRIHSVLGIINGTSNYILTRMAGGGLEFEEALREAQQRGYAEKNPKLDIEGIDAAHKLAILASLAFDQPLRFHDVHCEGIDGIDQNDIRFASQFGYVIKLVAICKKTSDNEVEARVQPTLLPQRHILSKVDGAYNAILFRGDEVGDFLLYGEGAGTRPTASAVVSDLVDLALGKAGERLSPWTSSKSRPKMKKMSSIDSRYYFRFAVIDKPKVLAKISGILGEHQVSISDVIQIERKVGNVVPLIMLTHHATEGSVREAIQRIDRLPVIRGKTHVLRVEE